MGRKLRPPILEELRELEVTTSEVAQIFRITDTEVSKLGRSGVLPVKINPQNTNQNLYPLIETTSAYLEYLHREDAQARRKWLQERARGAAASRARVELEVAVRRGELVPHAQVLATFGQAITVFRRQLLSLPARVSRRLLQAKDYVEVSAVLEGEILDALATLSELLQDPDLDKNGEFSQKQTR
jgi:phage terminase Nu1 subunit (DNA packaging protein)